MYLDGTKDLNCVTGELSNLQEGAAPSMLLGAKKLKSGISAHCLVWRAEDSKAWKDRNACGKISRSNSTYTGSPIVSDAALTSDSGSSALPPDGDLNGGDPISEGDRSTPIPTDGAVTVSESATPHLSVSIGRESVVTAVSSRGADKLIHLTAVVPAVHSESPHSVGAGPVEAAVSVTELESALRAMGDPKAAENPRFVYLRSRLPRKVASMGSKKGLHALAFGKESRVRSASRKNLVVDMSGAESADWLAAHNSHPPVLEVGIHF